jgi:hypothetical protein
MKRMNLNALLILSFLLLSLSAIAQSVNHTDSTTVTSASSINRTESQKEKEDSKKPFYFPHNLGVATGFTTGWGLSYRYFPGKFGYQANILGYKDVDKGDLSVGGTLLYSLYTTYFSNFYLYQANSYYYKYTNSKYPNSYNDYGLKANSFNHGLGFGLELIANEHYASNLMLGYGAFQNFAKISPTIELALYYKFK